MNLRRIRWAVRGVLLLGVAASVTANVLHARENPISQCIAAWPPLALLLTVELISRIPVHSRTLATARIVATALIAGIAAWVSYWHMAGVASRYGETGASPYLLPVSVDGLIVVASICLVELAGRIRGAEGLSSIETPAVATTDGSAEPVIDPWDYATPVVTTGVEPTCTAVTAVQVSGDLRSEDDYTGPTVAEATTVARPMRPRATTSVTGAVAAHDKRRRAPRSLTAEKRVTVAHDKEPDATHARIAQLAKVSVSTAKKYRPRNGSPTEQPPAETTPATVNGRVPDLAGV